MPISICFEYEPHPALIAVDLLVDTLFLVDIGLNFRTGFHDDAGLLVMERARISRRYLRSWFVLDAASSVPMQAIALVLTSSGVTGGGSLVAMKLLRLLKIGRLTRFSRIKALSTANVASSGLRKMAGLLLFYFMVTHFVACAFWAMASRVEPKDPLLSTAWGACEELVRGGRVAEQYVRAIYWTLLVMAVNDTAPMDAGQQAFSALVMVVGIAQQSVAWGARCACVR